MAGQLDPGIRERARRAVDRLAQEIPVTRALVFGSHVEGSADEWSDIDIAVFSPERQRLGLREYLKLMARVFRAVDDVDIEFHVYPAERLEPSGMTPWCRYVLDNGVDMYNVTRSVPDDGP